MRLTRVFCNKLASLINSYSNFNPSPLSLKKLADFGRQHSTPAPAGAAAGANVGLNKKSVEIQSYEFLKEEMLVRLALMTKEMLYLPENLIKTTSVQQVYGWYLKSFEEVLEHKNEKPTEAELAK